MAQKKAIKKPDTQAKAPAPKALHPAQVNDVLDPPKMFVSSDPNKQVKISPFKSGDYWLDVPRVIQFEDNKYLCKSKYVSRCLGHIASASGVMSATA